MPFLHLWASEQGPHSEQVILQVSSNLHGFVANLMCSAHQHQPADELSIPAKLGGWKPKQFCVLSIGRVQALGGSTGSSRTGFGGAARPVLGTSCQPATAAASGPSPRGPAKQPAYQRPLADPVRSFRLQHNSSSDSYCLCGRGTSGRNAVFPGFLRCRWSLHGAVPFIQISWLRSRQEDRGWTVEVPWLQWERLCSWSLIGTSMVFFYW